RKRPAAGSECWLASTTLPPMSAMYAPTAATMPGRSGHCRSSTARTAWSSEELQVGVDIAAQPGQVDLEARHARALRVDACLQLGLDAVLLEPGILTELDPRVVHHFVQRDNERLALRVRCNDLVGALDDRAGRVHPVQRLVRLGIGVDR